MGGCVAPKTSDGVKQQLCTSKPGNKPSRSGSEASKFTQLQLYLLGLMYDDLAKRCKDEIVSRDTFQVFFHNSGLMAQLMFSKFDQQKTGTILKWEFLKAFEINVKGSFEERANALFEFYSLQKSGGIRFSELLRILLSYPLEELNKMVFQDQFLKDLGDHLITYYFGHEKKIKDGTTIDDQTEPSSTQLPYQPCSLYIPTSSDHISIQAKVQKMLEEEKQKSTNKKPALPPLFKKENMNFSDVGSFSKKQKLLQTELMMKKAGSMSLIELKKIRKSGKLKSNITSVARRYATYLFTSANLDKQKDVFSKRQFCDLLKAHPSIFDVYLAGFHTDIWELGKDGKPKFSSSQFLIIEGRCKMLSGNMTIEVYLKLIKNTILIFDDQKSLKPKEIINLEGLIVEVGENNSVKHVTLKHRDRLYSEKTFTFPQKEDKWLEVLETFKQISILSDYVRLERIGKGNYSTVYKCKSKIKDQFAALKVIDPFKLSSSEREVLKRQIGILKQCHHPNIVKFIQEHKTYNKIYIVTELFSEGDLFDYTRKKGFLEQFQAALVLRQLTEAILYLNNEMGIIHRDLKPENIMIKMTQDKKRINKVKIIDFGFGVYKDQLKDLPQEQKFAGTPGFIAPEVFDMKNYDQKIDTFSLGIILYFMLYGYLPFQASYYEQIKDLTLNCNIILQNHHWSNVSPDAKDLIMKILTFSDKRISTKQILDHPWLQNINQLKQYEGSNKKRIKILE